MTRGRKSQFLYLVSGLILAGSLRGPVLQANPLPKGSLFRSPICNVVENSRELRKRLRSDSGPSSDGFFPWPGVLGSWFNLERDLYLAVSYEAITQTDRFRVEVQFNSICHFAPKDEHAAQNSGVELLAAGIAEFNQNQEVTPFIQMSLSKIGGLKDVPTTALWMRVESLPAKPRRPAMMKVQLFQEVGDCKGADPRVTDPRLPGTCGLELIEEFAVRR